MTPFNNAKQSLNSSELSLSERLTRKRHTMILRKCAHIYFSLSYFLNTRSLNIEVQWLLMNQSTTILHENFFLISMNNFYKNNEKIDYCYISNNIIKWFERFDVQYLMSGWAKGYSIQCQPVDYSSSSMALRMARTCWWYYFSKFTEFFDTVSIDFYFINIDID